MSYAARLADKYSTHQAGGKSYKTTILHNGREIQSTTDVLF